MMKRAAPLPIKPNNRDIAVLAYCMWQNEGCKPGHDLDYWLAAEKQLAKARGCVFGERAIEKPH
jgi:hypothetical protein